MNNCAACGHSVVGWCPDESRNQEDLVCYNCGLHVDSKATRRILELEEAVRDLLVTDKPAAWRLHLGESRYEEIKALEPPR